MPPTIQTLDHDIAEKIAGSGIKLHSNKTKSKEDSFAWKAVKLQTVLFLIDQIINKCDANTHFRRKTDYLKIPFKDISITKVH